MRLPNVRAAKVKGKRVLVRIDVNIELDGRGRVRDRSRIEAIVPTIRLLVRRGAAAVLLSHRGRPTKRDQRLSLRPMVRPLQQAIGRSVVFLPDPVGHKKTVKAVLGLTPGRVGLLENLRFEPGEKNNTAAFAKKLSKLGEVYVNDAFAASHRAASSIVGLARLLPAFAGLRLQEEVKQLTLLRSQPKRPYVAVLGGAKISTKLQLVRQLLEQSDHVLLGGALANTVLQSEGLAIGSSYSEPAMLKHARGLSVRNAHLHIPCDVVVVNTRGRISTRPVGRIEKDESIVDIGPDSVDLFSSIIATAATVVWNGPMGVYERPPFNAGTKGIARAIASSRARSVVGGGETVDAVRRQGLARKIDFLSTGGGAMVEFLEGRPLPGVQALIS